MKLVPIVFLLFLVGLCYGQKPITDYKIKKVVVTDSIYIDTVSINPKGFKVKDLNGKSIDTLDYKVNYSKGIIYFNEKIRKTNDTILISYLPYPTFLTRTYYVFDPKLIVKEGAAIKKLYSLQESSLDKEFTPFDGLQTNGSISRGITIGNNQNATVNSQLDLQITGKLSNKVSIRASIQDANIPTQEGGYSQSLDEFDQIFIELFSDNWNIRAGDINLQNRQSYFSKFTKKVQGISLGGTVHHKNDAKTTAFASGALVKGVFSKSNFVGKEGNQGPYKLTGPNGELLVLIVSGSERVYVNGLLLSRGENKDYVIDYNAGEIRFNPTFPITANMRILVEYQFTDRNYTRFIGYGGGNFTSKKLDVGVYVYSENDAKNQPLQQNLTSEQVTILQNAGDDVSQMVAPSAVADTYSENKILYKKEIINETSVFVFSNNPEDELFTVRFTLVGEGLGNYIISETNTISRIFEYVPPIDGVLQGNYEPIIQLKAPEKLQVGGVNASYHPSDKTNIDFEIAGSKKDDNLFSAIDDNNNDGFAGKLSFRQNLYQSQDSLHIKAFASLDYINKDFSSIERLFTVEFDRDWNIENPLGNQQYLISGIELTKPKWGVFRYEFQSRKLSGLSGDLGKFNGNRHVLFSSNHFSSFNNTTNASYMQSEGFLENSNFFRIKHQTTYSLKKVWIGARFQLEDNQVKTIENDSLSPESQKYTAYEGFFGIGDSTKVYATMGYQHRVNDSVRNDFLTRVSVSNTFYLRSKLIQNKRSQLSVFANYRELQPYNNEENITKEKNLSSRILYNQIFYNGAIRLNTAYQTNSGVLPQQEFTYLKVEAGQGIYTWIDYNNNNIQELEEFEVAQFQDQAEYIKIVLPNQVFIKIRENKLSQILTLNPQQWSSSQGFKKFISHFYNQTSFIINNKVKRTSSSFNINPFKDNGENDLGGSNIFKNTVFLNRGKQKYTANYTFIYSKNHQFFSLGLLQSILKSHQLQWQHKLNSFWLSQLKLQQAINKSNSENFSSRNYELESYLIQPTISYLVSPQTKFDVFYQYQNKENSIGDREALKQQKIGFSFSYAHTQKIALSGEFNYIDNVFSGSSFSPVAYQILEGLQPGTNFTWRFLFQKKITKYLDMNLTYSGRKSKSSNTIHTGSVQLRAYF
ncbi:MAG: hypothetical protein ACWA45_06730 [Flavobacteriales bacterium]